MLLSTDKISVNKTRSLNPLLVALAAFCWGLSGGIAGLLMAQGWDALVVSFYRGAIGLLLVLGWLVLRSRTSGLLSKRLWFWAGVAGLGVTGNFSFYFLSISEGSVAVAATLMYCAPVFVLLISFALRLERPTLLKWFAIILVILGVVLLTEVYKLGAGKVTFLAVTAGLLSGLSYALFIFGFKFAAPHGSPQAILVIAFTLFVLLQAIWGDAGQTLAVLTAPNWPLFVLLGVLGAGLSFILYILGLKSTPPALAAMIAMVEPVTASLFGVVVLHETLAALQLVGMALIILTVTTLSVYSST